MENETAYFCLSFVYVLISSSSHEYEELWLGYSG